MPNKAILATVGATAIIILGGIFLTSKQSGSPEILFETDVARPEGYEYFWGDGCPHCAKVQEFFDGWENYNKVDITKREIYNNRVNANLMNRRAQSCNIPTNQAGVPFLVTPEGECIIGDKPIIEHFKNLTF